MKSPVVYGNPVMLGQVDWNYAAGAPVRRGKSVEELGNAGWAKEKERMIHLQQLQQLHQLQLQQQQVGYPGYGGVPPGQLQGPVMVPSPGDPVPAPGYPMPVHGSMMSVQRGAMVAVGAPMPPPVHVPSQWPVQWENQAQIIQGNVCRQPSWEYDGRHKEAFKDKMPQGQDIYFHPGSEDGHLDLRLSEWKGKHCFYQGPEDYSRVPQQKDNNGFRSQEGPGQLDEDRRRDNYVRENENTDRYGHRRHRDLEEYDHKDKYKHRDHYDRKYDERYDDREQYHDNRKHWRHDLKKHDSYNSEYEDYYDHKDTYARYYERRYYDERKHKDHYYDRYAEDQHERREHLYKDRDVNNRRGEEAYSCKGRGQYDSELDKHYGYKEKDHYNRYKDTGDDRRDEHYNHRRRDNYKTKERYERRALDYYDHENEDCHNRTESEPYEPREGERSYYKHRDRYRNLRSISDGSRYEEYPKKDNKTHCEEWVEQQNQKLTLREVRSFEDPIIYTHSDEQEKGYESSAGSTGPKRGRKPVYVGSLDRNSFYRKTAPSSLRQSQFATNRKQNQGQRLNVAHAAGFMHRLPPNPLQSHDPCLPMSKCLLPIKRLNTYWLAINNRSKAVQ
ncbi:hypothetical protein PAMP_010290 [Pampus punctatissimus]